MTKIKKTNLGNAHRNKRKTTKTDIQRHRGGALLPKLQFKLVKNENLKKNRQYTYQKI